jgi:transcriptional regulator CtsR
MDTIAIRKKLIDKIKNSLPDNVVMDIARLVEVDTMETHVFTEEEQNLINKAIKSYEEGNFLTSKAAEDNIQQWLKD